MVTDLPREIPIDEQLPENMRDRYVRVAFAAEVTGTSEATIRRHLAKDTLTGFKVNERLWLVDRASLANWEPGQPGNPNWIHSKNSKTA